MKKGNKFKVYILATAVSLATSATVFAEISNVKVSKDIVLKTVTVNAKADANDVVTIQILPENITPEQIAKNPSLGKSTGYVRNNIADENGNVNFSFSINAGFYNLYMMGSSSEELYKEKFSLVDNAVYESFITELMAAQEDDFLRMVKENKDVLGFDIDIYSDSAVERFYDEYKDSLSKNDFELNLNKFKKCAMTECINSDKEISGVEYIKQIYADDTDVIKYADKFIKDEAAEDFFYDKVKSVSEKNIKNSEDLLGYVKEALVLTAVKYTDDHMEIKKAFEDFSDIVEIKNPVSYASVYRKLAGESFDNIEELKDAYNESKDGNSNTTGGGSGGGSGSSKNNRPSPGASVSGVVNYPSTAGQTQNMEIFDDLDSVLWAKPAIEGLYKAGVVNGKQEGKFFPQDNVLREEFVKMLVATFGIKLVGEDLPFTDVPVDSWYYDYVKTAYIAGVVTGISPDTFGAGQNITRQDICTMAYRMMIECDVALPEGAEKIEFIDNDKIADYAKEAVYALRDAGVINGTDTGSFNPSMPATRAETAKIMYGISELIERS